MFKPIKDADLDNRIKAFMSRHESQLMEPARPEATHDQAHSGGMLGVRGKSAGLRPMGSF